MHLMAWFCHQPQNYFRHFERLSIFLKITFMNALFALSLYTGTAVNYRRIEHQVCIFLFTAAHRHFSNPKL